MSYTNKENNYKVMFSKADVAMQVIGLHTYLASPLLSSSGPI